MPFQRCRPALEQGPPQAGNFPELGNEYQQLFGLLPYELITDGVLKNEIAEPAETLLQPFVIYFAGLLHI